MTPAREPLLLLPGTLCDERLWVPVLDRLGHPARVPRMRGAGTAPALASLLLRDAPQRFAVAGFSLGGIVALEMVAQAPERVARLAVVSGNARPDPPENAADRWRLVEAAEREGVRAVVERELWPLYVAPSRRDDPALRELVLGMAEAEGAAALREQTGAIIHRADSRPRLASVTVPVLAATGTEDPLCPPDRAAEIAASTPGGRAVALPGVGHFAPLEAPDAVAAVLAEWLAAADPAT